MIKFRLSFVSTFLFLPVLFAASRSDLSRYVKDEKGISKSLRTATSSSTFFARCKLSETDEIVLGESNGTIALLQMHKVDVPTLVLASTLTQTKKDTSNITGVFDQKANQVELMRWSAIQLNLDLKKNQLKIDFRLRVEALCQRQDNVPLSAFLPGSPKDDQVRWSCKGAAAEDRYVIVDSKKDGPALWRLGGYDPSPRFFEGMDWKNGIFNLSLVDADVTPEVTDIKKAKKAGPIVQRKTEYQMKDGTFVEEQITTMDRIPCSYQ